MEGWAGRGCLVFLFVKHEFRMEPEPRLGESSSWFATAGAKSMIVMKIGVGKRKKKRKRQHAPRPRLAFEDQVADRRPDPQISFERVALRVVSPPTGQERPLFLSRHPFPRPLQFRTAPSLDRRRRGSCRPRRPSPTPDPRPDWGGLRSTGRHFVAFSARGGLGARGPTRDAFAAFGAFRRPRVDRRGRWPPDPWAVLHLGARGAAGCVARPVEAGRGIANWTSPCRLGAQKGRVRRCDWPPVHLCPILCPAFGQPPRLFT